MKKTLCLALSLLLLCSVLCTPAMAAPAYTAGTYAATVEGRNGPLTVEVTFAADKIESVAVTDHEETPGISDSAINTFPSSIVAAQSLNVDTIAGATITCDAILAGVAECVKQAGANPGELQAAVEVVYGKNLKAGTYQGAAHGHHSDVVVEVVVTENAIESVAIVEEGETFNMADPALIRLPEAIVAAQSIGVDTIAGATYTSHAVLNAVADCIEQAGGKEALAAFSVRVPSEPWSEEEHVVDADVVVVGSGLSGIAAALSAQDNGADVVLVEKLPYYGGISQTANGGYIYADDPDDLYNYMMQTYSGFRQGDTYMNDGYPNAKISRVLADNNNAAADWLKSKGVEFSLFRGFKDAHYGKRNEDGTVVDAVMPQNASPFVCGDLTRPNKMGTIFKGLMDGFVEKGGKLYLETTAESLITDEAGAVVGVKAAGPNGKYTFNAKAVVLCAGGFGASEEMVAKYAPAYIGETNVTIVSNTGDGIRMGEEIGAAVYDSGFMMGSTGHTVVTDGVMSAPYEDNDTPMTAVYVNPQGARVNSENPVVYSNSTLHTNPDSRDYYWIIINEANASQDGYIDILKEHLAAGDERFHTAETLHGLANEIRIPPRVLAYTMNRYNQLCEMGEDVDQFKEPQYLVAMEEGPWYAVKAYMIYFGTIGGLVTDENAAVLNQQGTPIPGLYAAGENSNHGIYNLIYAGAYSFSGCLVFGQIAGANAAQAALK